MCLKARGSPSTYLLVFDEKLTATKCWWNLRIFAPLQHLRLMLLRLVNSNVVALCLAVSKTHHFRTRHQAQAFSKGRRLRLCTYTECRYSKLVIYGPENCITPSSFRCVNDALPSIYLNAIYEGAKNMGNTTWLGCRCCRCSFGPSRFRYYYFSNLIETFRVRKLFLYYFFENLCYM